MNPKRKDRAWLRATAKTIADELRPHSEGNRIRICRTQKPRPTDTGGWSVKIGDLGKGQPDLEIWLDRFSGYPNRKLYACFWSSDSKKISFLIKKAEKSLWPIRKLTQDDTVRNPFFVLKQKLTKKEFNEPVQENYAFQKSHFFGFYDPTAETQTKVSPQFCERAVGFFLDVAGSLPRSKDAEIPREVFPRWENRNQVQAHLRRERSGYLAAQCKERDDYRCQVCDMSFAENYGAELGGAFAEAHHLQPLGQQRDKVRTKPADLITVCANCHRMLHRMNGGSGDVKKLKAIVRRHNV